MAGGFSIFVSVLWVVYVFSTHYFYYEKLNSKLFGLDGILKKPYDGSFASDNAYFSDFQVYPVHGENQTDHAHSSNLNQVNHDFNISRNRQENNERPRRSSPIAQCTDICTGINDQHVLVCNRQHIPRQLPNLPPPPPPVNLSSTVILENPPMQTPDTSVVGEFLTIMANTMTEDVCLRTMLRTSIRIVDQILYRIYHLYHQGNFQDAVREWVGHLGVSLENGQDEGNMVLPAFDFSSIVQSHCDNPNCLLPDKRFNHVNVVLGRSLGNCGPNRLQRFIDGWFDTTERCNALSRPNNPEGSNATGERPATFSTTSCLGTRHRNRRLSSSQPQLVLPINLSRMQFSSSNELPTNVNFGGYRYRLAGVSFRMLEPNGRRWTSRIMHLGQSFYHSADSFESQPYQTDPLNSALSFAYYVTDTGDYITF